MSGVVTQTVRVAAVGHGRLAAALFTAFVVVTLAITVWAGRGRRSSEESAGCGRRRGCRS